MKKKHFFMAIAFFITGFICGTVLNFVLRLRDISILFSCLQGLFVGIFVTIIYIMLFLFFGYCYREEFINSKFGKFLIIFQNIAVTIIVMCGITTFITFGSKGISIEYAWMHMLNLQFAIAIVAKANYDGKVLRKK